MLAGLDIPPPALLNVLCVLSLISFEKNSDLLHL
jgi:hypothetical protein